MHRFVRVGRPAGRAAAATACTTKGATADVVLSSPLPRARETAEIIAPVLGRPIEFVADLEEHRPGEADGCPFVDFADRFGMFDFRAEPDRPFAPGW